MLAFVLSANSLYDCDSSSPIDDFGSQCLSVFRAMGLPSTAVFIRVSFHHKHLSCQTLYNCYQLPSFNIGTCQDLPSENKSRQELKKTAISFVSPELPEDCKFYAADTKDDLHKVFFGTIYY